jgi:2-polyprenyl-3-methyl-5-hydroxy-6-metoxy-1,4-benzoquinol methylase
MNINLENDGERMDIDYYNLVYDNLDTYQKSHYHRYLFIKNNISPTDIVGDMACGSGYGSMMLSENCKSVYGYDIDQTTIDEVKIRYKNCDKVNFQCKNLLDVTDENFYDVIVSFETIEHFTPEEIPKVIEMFHRALRLGGRLVFSTPWNQEKSHASMKHHKSFYITESTIEDFLRETFVIEKFGYQDYDTHHIKKDDGYKHFVLCVATKK